MQAFPQTRLAVWPLQLRVPGVCPGGECGQDVGCAPSTEPSCHFGQVSPGREEKDSHSRGDLSRAPQCSLKVTSPNL